MNHIYRSLSFFLILLFFSCNNPSKEAIEVVDFDGLYSKIDLSVDKTYVLNFWATWCAPCKKEMPSLDKLKTLSEFTNINILPINIGGDNYQKSKKFFDELKIMNLEIFTGSGPEFSQLFKLRGLPTTILIDRDGFEVGRIVGYIDFDDQSLVDWISNNL